jgi:predicted AlkP superfamily phosphohydrolase/phosphomutase
MQIEPGTYRIVKKYADEVPVDPFWRELQLAGRSCAVIDVPQTRPAEPFRGFHVVGWGGEFPAWPRSSSPPELMPEILRRFGVHPLADRYRVAVRPETEEQYGSLREDLLRGASAKAALSRWIFDKGPLDFFLAVFAETHWANHLLWDGLDPGHSLHDGTRAAWCEEVFRDLLGEIDRTIGDLRHSRPDAELLVFSLSGMGPNYGGWHILPEVLARIGMGPPKKPAGRWVRSLERRLPLGAIETAKAVVPARLWDRWTRRALHAGAGWDKSRAFCVPNDYSGAIRINLSGREPNGTVARGAEYEAVCGEIRDALLQVVHAETGRPIVREVIATRKAFQGPFLDELPDLLVLWANESPVAQVHSPRTGTIRLDFPERRTGAHRPFGFLAASGPRIRKSPAMKPVHLLDLAPTILSLMDTRVPGRFEGRVISEMIAG